MKNKKSYLLVILIIIHFCVSCTTKDSSIDEAVEFVLEYAENHPNGFTLDIQTYQPVTEGISVAYYETQNSFGKESLYNVVEHSLNYESIVGGWLNTEDSLYYFDSDKIFPDSSLQEAIEFAIENQQSALYDITNDSTIWVSDYGK